MVGILLTVAFDGSHRMPVSPARIARTPGCSVRLAFGCWAFVVAWHGTRWNHLRHQAHRRGRHHASIILRAWSRARLFTGLPRRTSRFSFALFMGIEHYRLSVGAYSGRAPDDKTLCSTRLPAAIDYAA